MRSGGDSTPAALGRANGRLPGSHATGSPHTGAAPNSAKVSATAPASAGCATAPRGAAAISTAADAAPEHGGGARGAAAMWHGRPRAASSSERSRQHKERRHGCGLAGRATRIIDRVSSRPGTHLSPNVSSFFCSLKPSPGVHCALVACGRATAPLDHRAGGRWSRRVWRATTSRGSASWTMAPLSGEGSRAKPASHTRALAARLALADWRDGGLTD